VIDMYDLRTNDPLIKRKRELAQRDYGIFSPMPAGGSPYPIGIQYQRQPVTQQRPAIRQTQVPLQRQQYTQTTATRGSGRIVQSRRPTTYNTKEFLYMQSQYGELAALKGDGSVMIKQADGSTSKRSFPSRPYAIRKMSERGWQLINRG